MLNMTIKHSTSELKQIYIGTSCFSYLNGKSISAVFIERFYDGDGSISIDKWDIRSLNSSYPEATPLNFALHIVCHLMYQIVKAAVEADASHEFITNLPSEMKSKLAREAPNYLVYGNKLLLLLGRYYSNHRL
ncbi:hypothetical protein HZH66_014784 [Vespula vulgaris]|uniref:Uncharacterized protein n=1 Tax=Vespula vulgaris TaxID=7454 RepID=A0A834MQP6_VESVU|nr:hypothetical protein HZH66_014784 [Vespula vulgaris]